MRVPIRRFQPRKNFPERTLAPDPFNPPRVIHNATDRSRTFVLRGLAQHLLGAPGRQGGLREAPPVGTARGRSEEGCHASPHCRGHSLVCRRRRRVSAQINGPRLTASGGLFVLLLVALSLIEPPVPGSDWHVLTPERGQSTVPVGSPPVHGSGNTPVAQGGAEPLARMPEAGPPWSSLRWHPNILTVDPGGAAHRPAA